jgi:excisionase family DNA binding protein
MNFTLFMAPYISYHNFARVFTALYERGGNLEALVSVEEAGRLLGGLSKWTIHAWLAKGKLRRTKVGSRTMIRVSELERVCEDGGKSPCSKSSSAEPQPGTGNLTKTETTVRLASRGTIIAARGVQPSAALGSTLGKLRPW